MIIERQLTLVLPVTVGVFARSPKFGEVKTRLAQDIGDAKALEVHEALLHECVERLAGDPTFTLELWLAGRLDHPLVMHLAVVHGVELRLQQSGDLGARMHGAMATLRAEGFWPIIVGSDLPTIDAEDIHVAAAALRDGCDLVLAPTEDGGYGLIGMRNPDPHLFEDISWGTDRVLTQTLARADSLSMRVHCLPQVWDLDDINDYHRWLGQ